MIMSNIQMIKVKVSSTFAFGRDFAQISVFHKNTAYYLVTQK